MTEKDWWTASISVVALFVSVFTFYWTTLRRRHAFYMIRTSDFPDDSPRFVLVNGGKSDILVTDAKCWFGIPTGGSLPDQRIEIEGGNGRLIKAGTASHWAVRFTSPLGPELAALGEPDSGFMNHFKFEVSMQIDWIDINGAFRSKWIAFSNFWLDAQGQIRGSGPLGLKFNLYAKSERKS